MSLKRALVTGGTGEIGAAICRRLASDGMHVLVHTHRRIRRADEIVSEIQRAGGSAEAIQFDVTVTFATGRILEEALQRGPIQVVVSNAGFHKDQPLAGMNDESWRSVIDVSLHGFFSVVRPLLLPMMKTRWGRIIAISSVSGLIGNRGQANYAAAKAGLHGAVKSLALEVATRGITVNVVAPGLVETPETMTQFDAEAIGRLIPMKRAGRPDEVAGLVRYLSSDEASYMTGQIVSINGGMA